MPWPETRKPIPHLTGDQRESDIRYGRLMHSRQYNEDKFGILVHYYNEEGRLIGYGFSQDKVQLPATHQPMDGWPLRLDLDTTDPVK